MSKVCKEIKNNRAAFMSNWSAGSSSTLVSCSLQCLKLSKDRRNTVLETWAHMFILPTPNTAHHFINMQVFVSSTHIKACEEMRTRESSLSHQTDVHTGRTPDPSFSILSVLRRPSSGLMLFRPWMLIFILKWEWETNGEWSEVQLCLSKWRIIFKTTTLIPHTFWFNWD